MAKAIAVALPILIGWLTWAITAGLSEGAYPLGRVGLIEKMLFWVPILGFCAPMAVQAFANRRSVAALWLLALAPVFGFVNGMLYIVFVVGSARTGPVGGHNPWVLVGLWLLPTVFMLARVLYKFARARRIHATG